MKSVLTIFTVKKRLRITKKGFWINQNLKSPLRRVVDSQLLQSMISCQVGLNSTSKRPQKWLKITFAFLSISFQGINIFQFFKKWVKLDERALLTRYHLWILIFCMTSIIWSKISDFYQNFQFFSDNFDSLIVLSLVFCYYMGLILLYMR